MNFDQNLMTTPSYVPLFQSICTSERLADLPSDTDRLFYLLLLAACDHWGRISARPRQLRVQVWPMLERSTAETVDAVRSIVDAGLVTEHDHPESGDRYLQVADWEEKAGMVRQPYHRSRSAFPLDTDKKREEEKRRKESMVEGPSRDDPGTIPPKKGSRPRLCPDREAKDVPSGVPADAWQEWISHLWARKRPTPGALAKHRKQLATLAAKNGPASAVALLDGCIGNNAQGIPAWAYKQALEGTDGHPASRNPMAERDAAIAEKKRRNSEWLREQERLRGSLN